VRLGCLGETTCRSFEIAADGGVYLARMRPGVEVPEWIDCFERENPVAAGGAAATRGTDRAAFFAEFDGQGQPVQSTVEDVGWSGYGTGPRQMSDGRWWMGAWTVHQDGRSQRSVRVAPQ
jgi:hypothetical protein